MHRIVFGILLITFASRVVFAEENKWTFGLGLGSQTIADYRGSSYYQTQFLPIPFVMYRGDIIKIDREGARGELNISDRVEFNISVDAALNGDSSGNPLREGMPELDSAVEIGPSINIRLTGEDFKSGWSLRLPVRAVITVSSDGLNGIGYLWSPKLSWREAVTKNQWQTSFSAGPIFADEKYHHYYYGVDVQYATANRPAYTAKGGYSGSFAKIGIKKQWQDWWFATYLRYDYLGGATFMDSPLVEEKSSATVGIAVVRLLDF